MRKKKKPECRRKHPDSPWPPRPLRATVKKSAARPAFAKPCPRQNANGMTGTTKKRAASSGFPPCPNHRNPRRTHLLTRVARLKKPQFPALFGPHQPQGLTIRFFFFFFFFFFRPSFFFPPFHRIAARLARDHPPTVLANAPDKNIPTVKMDVVVRRGSSSKLCGLIRFHHPS